MRKVLIVALTTGFLIACDQEAQETAPQGPSNQQIEQPKQ